MPGSEIPWALVALWKALTDNNWERARAIHAGIAKLSAFMPTLDAYVAVEKYLLLKQGIFTSTRQRGPVSCILSSETKKEIDSEYELLRRTVSAP